MRNLIVAAVLLEQGETAFDTFRAELDKSFNELERQLNRP